MVHGENTTVIQYELKDAKGDPASGSQPASVQLEVRPLIAFHDYHSTTHENGALSPHVQTENHLAAVAPYSDLLPLYFAHDADELDASVADWYRNFKYEQERERGLDFTEDLFSPLVMRFDLRTRTRVSVIASTEPHDVRHVDNIAAQRLSDVRR